MTKKRDPLSIEELRKLDEEMGESKTLRWAAEKLEKSIRTIRKYIKEGRLKTHGNGPGLRVLERSVLELKLSIKKLEIEEKPKNKRKVNEISPKKGFVKNW